MIQYIFDESYSEIFELNSFPSIAYLQKISSYTDYLSSFHTHQNLAELFFIEDGNNYCTINNKSYKIKKGDLILINSDILHNTLEDKTDIVGTILGIKNFQLKGFSKNQLISKEQVPVISTNNFNFDVAPFFSILNNLAVIDSVKHINKKSCANHILSALLMNIYEFIQDNNDDKKQDYNIGLKIKAYIDEHYTEDINLTIMAKALHINLYYLSHTCKKYLGYSPIQYITNQRIKEAQRLLLSTDLTVTEIAFECGYNNSNYFQTVFRNIVGMSPGKYRKSWK